MGGGGQRKDILPMRFQDGLDFLGLRAGVSAENDLAGDQSLGRTGGDPSVEVGDAGPVGSGGHHGRLLSDHRHLVGLAIDGQVPGHPQGQGILADHVLNQVPGHIRVQATSPAQLFRLLRRQDPFRDQGLPPPLRIHLMELHAKTPSSMATCMATPIPPPTHRAATPDLFPRARMA